MLPKKTWLTLALMIAVGTAPSCTNDARDESGDSAWSAYARGEYDAAERIWRGRVEEAQRRGASADLASALCSLSLIHERRGAIDAAETALKQCIDHAAPGGVTWTIAVQRLAGLYSASGDKLSARTTLVDAMAEFGGDSSADRAMRSEFLLKLGSLYQQERKFTEAEEAYRQTIELAEQVDSPSSAEAGWEGLARLYETQGRMEDAFDACKRWLNVVERFEPSRAEEIRLQCKRLGEQE